MTTAPAVEQKWITRPVADIPAPPQKVGGPRRGLTDFFRSLPAGEAVLVEQGKVKTLRMRQCTTSGMLTRVFTERRVGSRIDHDANGVWFWWEPR